MTAQPPFGPGSAAAQQQHLVQEQGLTDRVFSFCKGFAGVLGKSSKLNPLEGWL
jgi:hypothetical protein